MKEPKWMGKVGKKSPPLEKTRTDSVLKMLNAHPQVLARKRHQSVMSTAGDPDITGCVRLTVTMTNSHGQTHQVAFGQHFEIEMKQPGKKPTPLQVEKMAEWEEYGAWVMWATDKEEVREFFKQKGIVL